MSIFRPAPHAIRTTESPPAGEGATPQEADQAILRTALRSGGGPHWTVCGVLPFALSSSSTVVCRYFIAPAGSA